jgi:hypothetical protein
LAIDALKKQVPIKHHHSVVKVISGKKLRVRVSVCPECLGVILTAEDEYPNY